MRNRSSQQVKPVTGGGGQQRRFSKAQMRQLRRLLRSQAQAPAASEGPPAPSDVEFDILDSYCTLAPSPQNAVDVFAGEWASRLPVPNVESGAAPLFLSLIHI